MKKLLSFILGVCLIIPCAFMFTGCKDKPEAKIDTWDGTTIEVSAADENGVILIETAEELAGLAKEVNEGNNFAGKTIRLTCDMDMAGKTWTPIGIGHRSKSTQAKPFSGTFDGNGKKIIGLNSGDYYKSVAEENKKIEGDLETEVYVYHYGMFGYVTGATIKNLEVTVNFNCDSENLKGDSVGGVVGFSTGKLTMENCVANGIIDGGFDAAGGIVGRAYNGTVENPISIKNCVNNANVTADYKVSGILGYMSAQNSHATIDGCVNNGTINAVGSNVFVGGYSKRFVSMCAGITLYGWDTSGTNKVIVTNNTNNGNLITPETRSQEIGREDFVIYAYITGQVNIYGVFNEELHSYDFSDNENFGVVVNKPENETALSAFIDNILSDDFTASHEKNGTSHIATPVS